MPESARIVAVSSWHVRWLVPSAIMIAAWLCAATSGCSLGECRGDMDCPMYRVCQEGSCVLSCAYDASLCSAAEVCVAGHCLVACESEQDCPRGTACDASGVCLASPRRFDEDAVSDAVTDES